MSKNNVFLNVSLKLMIPFGFLGHVVAGRNDVRWSALSDKILSNAGLSSSLLVTCAQLRPPLLSVSLSSPLPYPSHIPHACFFLPTMHICGVDSCVCTWTSSKSGRASQWGHIGWVRCYNLECLLVKCGPGFYLDLPAVWFYVSIQGSC